MYIAGIGKAAEIAAEEGKALREAMAGTRDRLQAKIMENLPAGVSVRINSSSSGLPNTLSISIKGLYGSALLAELSDKVAASAGAACHSGGSISAVLRAIGLDRAHARGTLRLSTGRDTTLEEVDLAADLLCQAIPRHLH